MGDLVAAWFAFADRATQFLEGRQEIRLDEVGLQTPSLDALHGFSAASDLGGVHRVVRESTFFDQFEKPIVVEGVFHDLEKTSANFRTIPVADSLHEQLPERAVVESDFAEDVEDLTAESFALLAEFLKEPIIDGALAGLSRDQVPEVADLGLTNAMDTAEALFDAIGVPRQVVIDHQMGPLEIDALAGCVGGDENLHILVLRE